MEENKMDFDRKAKTLRLLANNYLMIGDHKEALKSILLANEVLFNYYYYYYYYYFNIYLFIIIYIIYSYFIYYYFI